MRRIRSEDGETRIYIDPAGRLAVVNLTPTVARQLEAVGFSSQGSAGWVPVPERSRRRDLGTLDVPEETLPGMAEADLWRLHDASPGASGSTSKLQVKLELARRLSRPCILCHHRCRADRLRGEGWCRAPLGPSQADLVLHVREEVVGATLCVYLGPGCSHRCRFCTMHELISARPGPPINTEALVRSMPRWKARGARSLTLIGGEPGIYVPWVLELALAEPDLPLVWNSNMYHIPEVGRLLAGVIDVYVADFKFGNDRCALRLAGTARYVEPVKANLRAAGADGTPLVVRHVVMPGHLDCCTWPVLRHLARDLPDAPVHLMTYIPEWLGPQYGLDRFTRDEDLAGAARYARTLGLTVRTTDGHTQ